MSDDTRGAPDCVHPEHARLQGALIELLNAQLAELRASVRTQTEEILELRRLIRVRDDMLLQQSQELERLRATPRGAGGWIARLLRGAGRSLT
jgi:hypothetical protein